jgi:hypothetical protein
MEFLRRLASLATQAPLPGAARAALPTRFASSSRLLRSQQSDADEGFSRVGSMPERSSADERVDTRPSAVSAQSVDAVRPDASAWRKLDATRPSSGTEPRSSRSGFDRGGAPDEQETLRARHLAEQMSRTEQRRAVSHDSHLSHTEGLSRADQEHSGDEVQRPVEPSFAEGSRRQPLSDAALSSRRLLQNEQTVVHVTIDRIDVRAPAAKQPAAPARPARKTTPATSLVSYLRGTRPSGDPP